MFARLVPFIYNSRDALVLVFQNAVMTVVQNGAPIQVGGVNYALTTPYLAADLPKLSYVQVGNVVTLVHPSYPPQALTRIANNNWTIAPITFGATMHASAQSDVSIGYDAAATSIVLAAGGGASMPATPFYAAWWDRTLFPAAASDPHYELVQVTAVATDTLTIARAQQGTTATTKNTVGSAYALSVQPALSAYVASISEDLFGWVYVITAVGSDGEESLQGASIEVTNAAHHNHPLVVSWAAAAGAQSYRIYRRPPKQAGTSVGAYGLAGVSSSVQFVDYARDPDFLQQPPIAKIVFASANNYPSAVGYWQQRRVFANTNTNPDTVWASQTGRHANFNISVPVKDDDAVTFRLVSDTVDEIRHIFAQGQFTLLTEGGEWPILGDQNGTLTPATINPRRASSHGVGTVRPVPASGGLLFPQALGSTVLELAGTSARDLTLFSTHLFDGHQIVDMAWQQETPHVAWFVRDDGVLLGLTYVPDQDVVAWHRHDMDGAVVTACVVPELIGARIEHRVYIVVGRSFPPSTQYTVECFASPFSSVIDQEAWFVDGGIEYDGRATNTPTASVSGLSHIEGRNVAIYAFGKVTGGVSDATSYVLANPLRSDLALVAVAGGTVALGASYLRVVVGLPFISDLETLDLDTADGPTIKTQRTNVSRVGMQVLNSRNIWAGGALPADTTPIDQMEPLALSTDADFHTLVTDFVEVNTQGQWNTNGRIALRSIDPTPFTVLSAVPEGYFPNPQDG